LPKITKRLVDATEPDAAGKRIILWDAGDGAIMGFGLLVLPSGVKSYIYNYRTPEARVRRITIGKHGGDRTPEQARAKARLLARDVEDGKDPLAKKASNKKATTLSDIFDAYLNSERFKSKAKMTQANDRGRIARHLRPLLGKSYVHALTPGDVEKAMADIRLGKTACIIKTGPRGLARVTGGEGAARMAIGLLRSISKWARGERLMTTDPTADIHLGTSGTRDTIVEDTAQYRRLFQTLDAMENEKAIRSQVADAIRVIALTGARCGEVTRLQWSHVDLKAGLITLPPNAHKSGRRTGKPRIIGLPAAAQAVIARQPKAASNFFVFTPAKQPGQTKGKASTGESGPISLSKPWRVVRVRAGLPDGIGLHGLRHSLASHMAMNGAEAAQIMTALGHRQLSTAQRYVHWAQSSRQSLAESAAATIIGGLSNMSDNVVPASKGKLST
jgi:integrase